MPLAHMCIYTSLWHLHTYVHLYFFMALAHMCIYTPYETCTVCAFIFLYGTYTCMCIYTSLWYLHTHVHLYFLWHLFTYVHLCFFMAPAHTCALILPMAPVHVCAFILPYGTCTHMCIYTSLWHLHTYVIHMLFLLFCCFQSEAE